MRTKYDIKGWPEGFIEFQRRITDFTGLLFIQILKGISRRGLDINDSSRS